jgi:penicillin-binding protein 2
VATLANGGTPVHPRLVRAVQDARTQEVRELPVRSGEPLAIKPEHVELVKAAMIDVTRPGGTAVRAAQGAPYLVAGKTGTAQVVTIAQDERYREEELTERQRDHRLFLAFAPAADPRIALGIVVENGGTESAAAPIARKVFDAYFASESYVARQP